MRIGFDLDGVLVKSESIIWALMGIQKDNLDLKKLYCESLKPLLNPKLFLSEEDKGFIVTARQKELRIITKKYCKHHFPDLVLLQADTPTWKSKKEWDEWMLEVAKSKAEIINRLKLDVYIEDMPVTIKHLRKLCPDTKIILYGGRIK